jgi:hypothetical protein
MVLDPGRDRYSIGAPVGDHHPECLAWVRSGADHLLLRPELWGEPMAEAA